MEIGDDFLFFIFYFWPEEPAAPVLTSPADSLRDSRYGPRRGRTQQAGAAPYGLLAALVAPADSLRDTGYGAPGGAAPSKLGPLLTDSALTRLKKTTTRAWLRRPRRCVDARLEMTPLYLFL